MIEIRAGGLIALPGVTDVWNEDREIWLIPIPSTVEGPELVRAAAGPVRELRARIEAELDQM